MPKKQNKPQIIQLSLENFDDIQGRLAICSLNAEDKKIIATILSTYQWLCQQLQKAQFSIRKLKSVFGFKTEKMQNLRTNKIKGSDFSIDTEDSVLSSLTKKSAENTKEPPKKKP